MWMVTVGVFWAVRHRAKAPRAVDVAPYAACPRLAHVPVAEERLTKKSRGWLFRHECRFLRGSRAEGPCGGPRNEVA